MASKIASIMNDDMKRKMIQGFYDRHKNDVDFEHTLKEMRVLLNYFEEDVPVKNG